MLYRIAYRAIVGFLVAGWWALYFAFEKAPDSPVVYFLVRLLCPIAIAGSYFAIKLYWVLLVNAATYALVGLIADTLHRFFHHSKWFKASRSRSVAR